MSYASRRRHAILARAVRKLPRREWERHPLMIHGKVPAGSRRTTDQQEFLDAVRASPHLAHARADRWTSIWAIAESLARRTDWQLGTARPTWAILMADTGLSRRTIARRLVDLQHAGLLGVVATGRTAGTDPHDVDAGNHAAVYVLAVPHSLRLLPGTRPDTTAPDDQQQPPAPHHQPDDVDQDHRSAQNPQDSPPLPLTRADAPVDKPGTPSLSPLVTEEEQPTHAREHAPKTTINHERASSPSPIRDLSRAQLIAAGPLCSDSERAPGTKNGRLLAAAELRRRDPILGRASTPDVASMLRIWLLAGWTINDIHHALNHRPDGTPWPHQLTVADIADVRGWTRYRLRTWLADPLDPTSPPGRSPSARAKADQVQARARARARAEADKATRAARMPVEDRPPAITDALRAARDRIRHAQHTRAHRPAAQPTT